MTIVASNNITVSNVNDGTITHYAYAYSADGTERFTTVYPALNLLSNSLFNAPIKTAPDSNSAFYGLQSNVVGSEYLPSTSNRDLTINSLYVAGLELPIGVYTSSITIANNSETVATVNLLLIKGTADTDIRPVVNGNSVPWWFTPFGNPAVTINIPANSNARYTFTFTAKSTHNTDQSQFIIFRETTAVPVTRYSKPKLEPGSIATPYMPSSSEATTADYPSYIGQYTDFTSTASTDPTKYAPWTVFKGNDGKDGTGIQTTTITYAGSTSGTTAPTSGWTSTIPTVAAGSYLWTKTVWTYTDNTSETGYSVAKMGDTGPDGNPGKVIQQNTEPTNKFLDMLWQYTGAEPLNATGITAQPNMTYVWNGTSWQIWFLNPANLQAVNAWITNAMIANAAIDFAKINSATIENLSAVNSILGDVKAGKITNEFEYESSAGKTKGTLVIDEIGLRMDYVENEDETKPGSLQVSPSGMTVSRYNTEGLRETASYTQKGMVMSSDVLPMKLSWQGITATANYERSFDIVYITGRGNWGKFEANKERFFGSLPKSVWPQYEIASGASSMGGAQNMAVKITTDGRIGITSSVAKDNCYAGFSITYRAIPNVS
ncbi:hypothetical protein MKK30_03470 [Lactococcus formosensis]|uniref:hypothetical protein n=1 Tax=Lactococcus formosensis TaxID=1281486 RepID=UPI001F05DCF9|nr:hypothetical protein [Lactococcus formosensis]MCH1722689.1 hypothetical protein [Lactococcus formosensis]